MGATGVLKKLIEKSAGMKRIYESIGEEQGGRLFGEIVRAWSFGTRCGLGVRVRARIFAFSFSND
jgi:hypothetical protein